MMQGVKAVNHILYSSEEMTFRFPGVVNRRDWKGMGCVPKQAVPEVNYHDVDNIIAKEHPLKKLAEVG